MSAPTVALLAELRGHGLRLSVGGDERVHVAPRAAITAELDAVIRANKAALLNALLAEQRQYADLPRRIQAMGHRWRYTVQELDEALAGARDDPAGWLRLCEMDEARLQAPLW
jgi:hypothetical protein